MTDIDRLAPTRYFVEAAIAIRGSEKRRLHAALELAQVTGAAELAMSVFVAEKITRFKELDVTHRQELSSIAKELKGPMGQVVRIALEKLDGK